MKAIKIMPKQQTVIEYDLENLRLSNRWTDSHRLKQITVWETKIASLSERLKTETDEKKRSRCEEIIKNLRWSIEKLKNNMTQRTR